MATMKDVAREVRLSITTVSRALNDHDDVAEETRTRIQDAARALDYHPNAVARSLQKSRTNIVGLVIPPVLHRTYDAFWLEFIGGVATECSRHGLDILLSTAEPTGERTDGFARLVRGQHVDGLLVCDVQSKDARIDYLKQQHIPFVAFGRTTGDHSYSFIDVDGESGSTQAMEHLIRLGHRRIAYLGVDSSFGFSHFRLSGYHKALKRARLAEIPELVCEDLSEISAHPAVARLLSLPEPPTAIFASADFLALTALAVVREAGMSVPDDVSLAVFDDNILVQTTDPPLTAVSQPHWRIGEEAAAMLLESLANPALARIQRLVVPTLIVRQSTALASNSLGREASFDTATGTR